MGRELSVDRIDFMKDGSVIIRSCDDRYVCGRTEFTEAIAQLFYDRGVTSLIVNYPKKTDKIHIADVDGEVWTEKEFDLEVASVEKYLVDEICLEHIAKEGAELKRGQVMLEDAKAARKNTTTVKDFQDFSSLIDELQDYVNEYFEEAKTFHKYVDSLNLCCDDRTTNNTYILLTLSE